MGFLAQIDCAAARAAAPELALPDAGLLSFFLGLDPDYEIPSFYSEVNHDGEGARVVYTPPGSTLGRMAVPADMPTDYLELERPVCKLKFVRGGAVLPEASNPIVAATSAFSTAQAQAYAALAELVNGDDEDSKHWGSRIGGHPAILQNDTLEIEAESLERGLDLQTGQQWNDPDFARASAQWCQLMQMASEDAAEWLWGDGGLMHWMVRQTELSTAVFTRAWAIGVN